MQSKNALTLNVKNGSIIYNIILKKDHKMKSYILPFSSDVEVQTYQYRAFPLGIIKAVLGEYDIFLCNRLINVAFSPDSGLFDFLDDDLWGLRDGFGTMQSMFLHPDTYGKGGMDIIELNKSMIDSGHYINGEYNEFYIRQKASYNKRHFEHDYLIFGYDDEKRVFKSAGYLADKKYSMFDIDYEDYLRSVINAKTNLLFVHYIKYNQNISVQLNTEKIKEELNNYLGSKKDVTSPSDNIYGISAWNRLCEYVDQSNDDLDFRFGRLFAEHKSLMLYRMNKLSELKACNADNLIEQYRETVYSIAQQIHKLFIKYTISGDKKTKERIVEKIRSATEAESRIIEQFILKI